MLIDKPGYYTSRAGKCEVVAVRETDGGMMAVGYCAHGDASIWLAANGHMQFVAHDLCSCHITGPFSEPRKPIEAWAILFPAEESHKSSFHRTKAEARARWENFADIIDARLVHLREVED